MNFNSSPQGVQTMPSFLRLPHLPSPFGYTPATYRNQIRAPSPGFRVTCASIRHRRSRYTSGIPEPWSHTKKIMVGSKIHFVNELLEHPSLILGRTPR